MIMCTYMVEADNEYLSQLAKVQGLIHKRLKMLGDIYGVPALVGHNTTAVDIYIRETRRLSQSEKMAWLSCVIGMDHGEFMHEWTILEDIKRYKHRSECVRR